MVTFSGICVCVFAGVCCRAWDAAGKLYIRSGPELSIPARLYACNPIS